MSDRHFEHLTIRTNACFDFPLGLADENNVPDDLTGQAARLQFRTVDTGELVVELSTTNGRITLGAGEWNFVAHLEEDDCAALAPFAGRPLKWDGILIYTTGHTEALPIEGSAEVVVGVTHD